MRVAAVQLESTPDRDANLAAAARLVGDAAGEGATFVVLPELFACLGSGPDLAASAEPLDGSTSDGSTSDGSTSDGSTSDGSTSDGSVLGWAAMLATRHGIWLQPGSFVERDADRRYNTTVVVDPSGDLGGRRYRKVHLFDVDLADTGVHESRFFDAGDGPAVAEVDGRKVGLTICYDLRFPELARIEALEGAEVVTVPSAFTARTGRDHWEVLVRARAVENQLYVVAPGQCGTSADGVARHGHSMIVDPWGTVVAEAGPGPGFVIADIDPDLIARTRRAVPSLANRRPTAYRWP